MKLREQMCARAQPETLGSTILLLQKQIQNSLLGSGALTGQKREEKKEKRGKVHRNKWMPCIGLNRVHYFLYSYSLWELCVLRNFHVRGVMCVCSK